MGFVVTLAVPLAAGATVVTLRKFGVEVLVDVVERHRPTALIGPPAVLQVLAGHPAVAGRDLSSLEVIAGGGAPLAPELQEAVAARFPDAVVLQGYGMTETSAPIPARTGATAPPPARSSARRRARSPRGRSLWTGAGTGAGEAGELWVRGPAEHPGLPGASRTRRPI